MSCTSAERINCGIKHSSKTSKILLNIMRYTRDMNLKELQEKVRNSPVMAPNPFKNPSEIMLAATEELGEVAQEVALLEKIGTKAAWTKEPSTERLGGEITNVINCIVALANHYNLDLESLYLDAN
jgi:NTP pyrophosphatase (non-canonical NTP hydrolase)